MHKEAQQIEKLEEDYNALPQHLHFMPKGVTVSDLVCVWCKELKQARVAGRKKLAPGGGNIPEDATGDVAQALAYAREVITFIDAQAVSLGAKKISVVRDLQGNVLGGGFLLEVLIDASKLTATSLELMRDKNNECHAYNYKTVSNQDTWLMEKSYPQGEGQALGALLGDTDAAVGNSAGTRAHVSMPSKSKSSKRKAKFAFRPHCDSRGGDGYKGGRPNLFVYLKAPGRKTDESAAFFREYPAGVRKFSERRFKHKGACKVMLAHAALLEGNIVAGCGSPRPVQFQHARSLGHAGCANIITDCDTDVLVKGLPKTFAAKLESALVAASATANATTKVINDARGQGAAPPVKMIHWDDGGANSRCRRRRARAGGARVVAGSADYAALALDEEGQAAADAEAKESLASGSTHKQRRKARKGVGLRGAVLGAICKAGGRLGGKVRRTPQPCRSHAPTRAAPLRRVTRAPGGLVPAPPCAAARAAPLSRG